MKCPHCSTEWDVRKSPCPQCGIFLPMAGRSGTRPTTPYEWGIPLIPQNPHVTQNARSSDISSARQQSGGVPPIHPQSAGGVSPSRSQSNGEQQLPHMPFMKGQENVVFPTQSSNVQMPTTPYPSYIPPLVQQTDLQRKTRENSQPSLPAQSQWDRFATPANPSMNAIPDTPHPANMSSPDYDNTPFLARLRKDDAHEPGSAANLTSDIEGSENALTRNVPHRPQVQRPLNRSTENLLPDAQRSIRPSRLVTDPLAKEGQRRPVTPTPLSSGSTPILPKNVSPVELPRLVPGTLLRGGRYRLRVLQGRQDWLEGVSEATWVAQDAQRSGSQVMICELVTPDSKSMVMQSTWRNATMALTSIGRHPHIPTLWDAFSDQGRNFFVFEPTEGQSLAARLHRTGRALPEQDVIECCLQMTEILEILVQQSPPLVHGLIRPEHIIIGRTNSDYTLTNFSIILAGGATQYVAGIDRSHLTPYMSPEFVRGIVDGRSDLYSLLATAYYAATGSLPVNAGVSIPEAHRLNPTISSAFDAILARGLRPIASQRYQRPSELRQDLLAMRSVNGTLTMGNVLRTEPQVPKAERPVSIQTVPITPSGTTLSQVLPSTLASSSLDDQEQKLLLPRPEELPAMQERNDVQQAVFWLVGILICLMIVVIVSRGFM